MVRLDDDKENTICKVSDMETRISWQKQRLITDAGSKIDRGSNRMRNQPEGVVVLKLGLIDRYQYRFMDESVH